MLPFPLLALLFLLLFLFPFPALPVLVVLTPAVLSLRLLLVTTAVFEGTVLPLAFLLMLAFVSTTPLRVALLPLPALPEFALSSPPQAVQKPATASKQKVAIVRRIVSPCDRDYGLAVDVLASIRSPIILQVFGVFIRAGVDAHHDTTFVDASLIFFRSIFRNTRADQCSYKAAG